jgi:hypothetical protein
MVSPHPEVPMKLGQTLTATVFAVPLGAAASTEPMSLQATVASTPRVGELAWARWGVAAGVVGAFAFLLGTGLIPPAARLEAGPVELARVLAESGSRLYFAAFLAVAGAVLRVALFVALAQLVPQGNAGSGLLRLAVAGCIVTQTLVAVGGVAALVGVNAALTGMDPAFVTFCWRALWLSFIASAVPTVLYTVSGVLGVARAGLSPGWVSVLGWISAAAHVVVLFALDEKGLFALDGLVGMVTPVTTVAWVLALCAMLPGRVRRRA